MVYDEHALSCTTTYTWFRCFKNRRESLGDDERSGAPVVQRSTKNIAAVCCFLLTEDTHLMLLVVSKILINIDIFKISIHFSIFFKKF